MAAESPTAEIAAYITSLDSLYRAGNATEHSYRPALKTLLEALTASVNGIAITNEPKHIACGAPDYIITKNGIPLGYIEAKDIPVGIDNKANKKQIERYKKALGNLILTDYLSFRLFAEGEVLVTVTIAVENGNKITPDKKQFPAFLELIHQFINYSGATIYDSEQLAKIMADKAKLLAGVIKTALPEKSSDDSLAGQYEGFKKILIHNLQIDEFADIYAQTLSYGLFAARLNQRDNQTFTRFLAAQLIPQSNPFLKKFFNFIAGIELDSRIVWIVDALSDVFNYAAIEDLLKEFEKANQDPYIHFYETFLAAYDNALRELRGVYYTPIPVVKFIVDAVDTILKTEFDLPGGIADYSKVKKEIAQADGSTESIEFHKVQILDPATGTGTFLAEVIEKIYSSFANNKGAWNDYCEKHLIPRLHGFEILMASYAMAHFKLDMILKETGFSWNSDANNANKRFHIYLTNTLEEAPEKVPELFMARWLAQEAEEASRVKRDAPVMVVIANPPYNVSTQNRNDWIDSLLADYKKDLNERKLNLDDDYIKFIRYGQYLIEKNGFGVLAYISNNSFIDGLTHRTMRKALLDTFDQIYVLDLHGNARKKEAAPDGGADGNVFDIMQGTCIIIFIKTSVQAKQSHAQVYHSELFGRRNFKYQFLYENKLSTIKWEQLSPEAPYFFFMPKNFSGEAVYKNYFSLTELFPVYNSGIKTERDSLTIHFSKETLQNVIDYFKKNDVRDIKEHFKLGQDSRDWKIEWAKKDLQENADIGKYIVVQYRPFDMRYTFYTGKSKGFIGTPGYKIMKHFIGRDNFGLVASRQNNYRGVFITKHISEVHISSDQTCVFPLYLYPDEDSIDPAEPRRTNLNMSIVNEIVDKTGLRFTPEKESAGNTVAPIDILDYIYAVLHSPAYREKYREFLKIDFPRVPYPTNAAQFQTVAAIGAVLRGLHVMQNVHAPPDIATFPIIGTCEVENPKFKGGAVWINKHQYFDAVPAPAWEFYIGGYQPAQKWLKDRKCRSLSFDDIEHYRSIIFVLTKTIELQEQIDGVMH